MNAMTFFRKRLARAPKSSEARGISSYLQSPYSPWIPITPKRDPDQDPLYSYPIGYMNTPYDGREELLIDRQSNNGYKMQDSYGGYEDGGYGAMQNSVAFSALGFMSFLFFLKMIGDTINMLDGGLPVPINKKRDSRSVTSSFSYADGKLDWDAASLIIGLLLEDRTDFCKTTHLLCKVNGRASTTFGDMIRETFAQQSQRLEASNLIAKATNDGRRGKTCHPYLKTCHEKEWADNAETPKRK